VALWRWRQVRFPFHARNEADTAKDSASRNPAGVADPIATLHRSVPMVIYLAAMAIDPHPAAGQLPHNPGIRVWKGPLLSITARNDPRIFDGGEALDYSALPMQGRRPRHFQASKHADMNESGNRRYPEKGGKGQ
jgi:hypothetical protein